MRSFGRFAQFLARTSLVHLIAPLTQAETAQAIPPTTPMPTSRGGTAGTACIQRASGSGRVDISLTGPSGTRYLLGTCPTQRSQTFAVTPPSTVTSYHNRSRCRIILVDNDGMIHPIPVGSGKIPNGLVVRRIVIETIG